MQKRRLSADIEVSVIGLGTVKFGRNQGVKYPESFELPNDQTILNLLSQAKEAGINLLDTAPAYGFSEERIGKLLTARHDWVIATKAGEEFLDGKSHFDFSQSAIEKSIHRSLKRLRTDYLDIVLIHSNGDDEKIIHEDEVFVTLNALKQAGKIRHIGMSTKTIKGGLLSVDQSDVVMVTFNPIEQQDREVIQYAQQKQKGIFIKKAFASGHLSLLSEEDPIQNAMQFIFGEPGVTSVIVGTINPLHLKKNIQSVEAVL